MPSYRRYQVQVGAQGIIILGGGGPKSKKIKALQDDPKLKAENYFLRWLSEQITVRLQSDITSLMMDWIFLEILNLKTNKRKNN